jgi:carboxymethylenebutenolidase
VVLIDELTLDTDDGPMGAYQAVPDGGARRAVIVIQEAFGVNDHMQDVTRRFADAGYHAIAPALFHRAGGGTAPYDDFEKVLPLFEGLTDPGIVMDVDSARAHLGAAGFGDRAIGIVGFCMGGRVTFLASLELELGAAVGFYGGGIVSARFPQFPPLIDRVGDLKTPWLGLFGDEDSSIPVEDVERLRQELDGADVPAEVVRYAGAEHGFHCDQRPSYHAEAATDAWARTLAWFEEHLEPRD